MFVGVYTALITPFRDGAVDHKALTTVRPQTLVVDPGAPFALFRLGDAISSRNIHAAIYDATRLCMTF